MITVNSPVLGKIAKTCFERCLGTIVGGWLGCAFFLVTRHPAWTAIISFLVAAFSSMLAVKLKLDMSCKLLSITFILGVYGRFPTILSQGHGHSCVHRQYVCCCSRPSRCPFATLIGCHRVHLDNILLSSCSFVDPAERCSGSVSGGVSGQLHCAVCTPDGTAGHAYLPPGRFRAGGLFWCCQLLCPD